ncbi:hypothetical protein EDD11_008461 [Mortierella claussenii]|nr:hypothetical protein EDD11_008461 [Mortierella claussenii]
MVSQGTPRFRIALLVCGTPIPPVAEAFGEYPAIFRNFANRGLEDLKQKGILEQQTELFLEGFDVRENNYPENLQDWDAIMISGSASNAYDDLPWINNLVGFVQKFPRTKEAPKLIGICFGHQIIGRAFNAKVSKNPRGWELGWTSTVLTKEGQTFWGDTAMRVQELHQDVVHDVPEGFTLLASTEHTSNQSMISNDYSIVSIQGHPEFSGPIMKEFVVFRTANGTFNKELSEATMKVVDNPLDSVKVAARVLQFMQKCQ